MFTTDGERRAMHQAAEEEKSVLKAETTKLRAEIKAMLNFLTDSRNLKVDSSYLLK